MRTVQVCELWLCHSLFAPTDCPTNLALLLAALARDEEVPPALGRGFVRMKGLLFECNPNRQSV